MTAYIIRKLIQAIPLLIGVNLLTFLLFFVVSTPENMARAHLGEKYVTQQAIDTWIQEQGYHKPLFINQKASGINILTETIFYEKSLKLFLFDFGTSDSGRSISHDLLTRMKPSLALAVPTFVIGLLVNIFIALLTLMFKSNKANLMITTTMVCMLSVSYLFYIIIGQYLFAGIWQLVPVSGYTDGSDAWRFLVLPVTIGVVSGIGAGSRWYRTLFSEVIHAEYVRTAKAQGASEFNVLIHHVLPNTMLPILTGIVVLIPSLFMGSILMEAFFGIPGLGSYMLDGIKAQDFAIVRSIVFLGSVLYIAGLLLTDITYTLADPRVRLNQ